MNYTCEITTKLSDPPTFREFENTPILDYIHRKAPRFGRTSDILTLLVGSEEEKKDYIRGLAASSIAILFFLFVWAILLLYAKWKGPEKFGWLSGSRLHDLSALTVDKNNNQQETTTAAAAAAEDSVNVVVQEGESKNVQGGEEVEEEGEATTTSNPTKQEQPVVDSSNGSSDPPKNGTDEEDEGKNQNETSEPAELPEPTTPFLQREEYERLLRQQKIMKIIVALACFGIVLGSILLAVKGGEALVQTVSSARDTLNYGVSLMEDGAVLMDRLIEGMYEIQTGSVELLEAVNGICPNVREKICTSLDDFRTCNTTGIFATSNNGGGDGDRDVGDIALEKMVNYFNSNRTIVNKLERARVGLDLMMLKSESVDETASDFNWALYLSIIFVIPLSLICMWIVVAVFFKKNATQMKYFRPKYIIPLIMLFSIVSFSLSVAFIITSMIVADLCIDDPDARLLQVVEYYFEDSYPILFEFILLYLSRCEVQPVEFVKNIDVLQNGVTITGEFGDGLKEKLSAACGGDGSGNEIFVDVVNALTFRVNELLCTIANLGVTIRKYFQCSTWYPLYQSLMQDTLCYSATPAFTWIAATQFLILVMIMVILTLRVVLWDVDFEEVVLVVKKEEQKQEKMGEEEKNVNEPCDMTNKEEEGENVKTIIKEVQKDEDAIKLQQVASDEA